MVAAMFSFEGRIGRLAYALRSLAMLAAMFVVVLAIVVGAAIFAKTQNRTGLVVAVLCVMPLFGAGLRSSLSLQARRIRDLGWSPGVVIGGWFLLNLADTLVLTYLLPGWANSRGTYLGNAVNIGLSLVLLLWLGRRGEGGTRGDVEPKRDAGLTVLPAQREEIPPYGGVG